MRSGRVAKKSSLKRVSGGFPREPDLEDDRARSISAWAYSLISWRPPPYVGRGAAADLGRRYGEARQTEFDPIEMGRNPSSEAGHAAARRILGIVEPDATVRRGGISRVYAWGARYWLARFECTVSGLASGPGVDTSGD
jgi:hypothetical protein